MQTRLWHTQESRLQASLRDTPCWHHSITPRPPHCKIGVGCLLLQLLGPSGQITLRWRGSGLQPVAPRELCLRWFLEDGHGDSGAAAGSLQDTLSWEDTLWGMRGRGSHGRRWRDSMWL